MILSGMGRLGKDLVSLKKEHKSSVFKSELCIVTFFQRGQYEDGVGWGVFYSRGLGQILLQSGDQGEHQ